MLQKLAKLVANELKQRPDVSISEDIVVFGDLIFEKNEVQLLKKLGEDKIFTRIVDKLIMRVARSNLNVHSLEELHERNGAVKALKSLLAEIEVFQEKKDTTDYRTLE